MSRRSFSDSRRPPRSGQTVIQVATIGDRLKERPLSEILSVLLDGRNWGALLPDGLTPTERQLLAEAAVEGPTGERRMLVVSCHGACREQTQLQALAAPFRSQDRVSARCTLTPILSGYDLIIRPEYLSRVRSIELNEAKEQADRQDCCTDHQRDGHAIMCLPRRIS